MASTEGLNGYCIPGSGLTASGNSSPFFLSPARTVLCLCDALSVASGGSITMVLAACTGDPGQASGWTPVVSLPTQSGAGVQQAAAAAPSGLAGSNPMWRLQWTVTGNGASVVAVAAGVS